MIERCDNCRFWLDDATEYGLGEQDGYGMCRRYPNHELKDEANWCGEWTPDAMAEIERMGAEIYDQNRS